MIFILKKHLKASKRIFQIWFRKKCSKNSLFSSFYYLIKNNLRIEHQAVLAGISAFENNEETSIKSNLRRNIHRIEKGLIARPQKATFATEYILETIISFKNEVDKSDDFESMVWAENVLNTYFSRVQKDELIMKAEEEFMKIKKALPQYYKENKIPYRSDQRVKSNITYDKFLLLAQQRRSVRYYRDTPVPHELIEKAMRVALLAPSACNRQPYKFRVIDQPDILRNVTTIPLGTKTYATNIPMMIFVIGDQSYYSDERDRHLIYIDSSLATMSFVFALETLGLSSCIINWPDIKKKEILLSSILGLKTYERCVLCISVGFALEEGEIPYSQKKSLSTTIKFN